MSTAKWIAGVFGALGAVLAGANHLSSMGKKGPGTGTGASTAIEASSATTATQYFEQQKSAQVDRLRETAKWIVGVFGALGAVLAGGIQLSSAGKLEGDWRLAIAVASGVVAILAIGAIVWHASRVLVEGEWTVDELAAEETKKQTGKKTDRFLLLFSRPRYPATDYVEAVRPLPAKFPDIAAVKQEREAIREFRSSHPKPTLCQREALKARNRDYDRAIRRLEAGITFALVRECFERAVLAMFVFGAVAIGAITFFAWAVNPPEDEAEVGEFRVPVRARLFFTGEGKQSHTEALGAACVANPVEVIVLRADSDSADVVTVGTPCAVARFAVEAGVGSLNPIDPVRIPAALASPTAAGQALTQPTATTVMASAAP